MNKAELVNMIATITKLSKMDCKKFIDGFIDAVSKSLKKGHSIVLTNFGTFTVINRKPRMGVNPTTGGKIKIPAKKVPKFKPGKKLKNMV